MNNFLFRLIVVISKHYKDFVDFLLSVGLGVIEVVLAENVVQFTECDRRVMMAQFPVDDGNLSFSGDESDSMYVSNTKFLQ